MNRGEGWWGFMWLTALLSAFPENDFHWTTLIIVKWDFFFSAFVSFPLQILYRGEKNCFYSPVSFVVSLFVETISGHCQTGSVHTEKNPNANDGDCHQSHSVWSEIKDKQEVLRCILIRLFWICGFFLISLNVFTCNL